MPLETYIDWMESAGLITRHDVLTRDTHGLWIQWKSLSKSERAWVQEGWIPATYNCR